VVYSKIVWLELSHPEEVRLEAEVKGLAGVQRQGLGLFFMYSGKPLCTVSVYSGNHMI
jgi:hypothetical protein